MLAQPSPAPYTLLSWPSSHLLCPAQQRLLAAHNTSCSLLSSHRRIWKCYTAELLLWICERKRKNEAAVETVIWYKTRWCCMLTERGVEIGSCSIKPLQTKIHLMESLVYNTRVCPTYFLIAFFRLKISQFCLGSTNYCNLTYNLILSAQVILFARDTSVPAPHPLGKRLMQLYCLSICCAQSQLKTRPSLDKLDWGVEVPL